MTNDHTLRWRCCVCLKDATLHEVAKGGDRRPFGIRHHIQLPACIDHHVPFFHGVGGLERECKYYDKIYGLGEYGRTMFLVTQRNHSELEKTDAERLKLLMEYSDG